MTLKNGWQVEIDFHCIRGLCIKKYPTYIMSISILYTHIVTNFKIFSTLLFS